MQQIGTLVARGFEFTIICGYLFLFDSKIGFRISHIWMKTGELWREYIRISIPVLVSDMIFMFGNSAVAMVIGKTWQKFCCSKCG